MNTYAKLVGGQLQYAPYTITIGTATYSPATAEACVQAGYKKVIYVDTPTDAPARKHYEASWKENKNNITQKWTLVDDTPAQICQQLRYWFDTEYREANEKLTRFAALKITETVTDKITGATYTKLADLYTAAELVRAEIKSLENEASLQVQA